MFLALVKKQRFHVVVLDRFAGQVEVLVAQRAQYAEALASTAAEQQHRLGLVKRDHPRVALGRRLLVLHVDALAGHQVEAFRLHLGDQVRIRPRYVWRRPVRGAARPDAGAVERRRDLHDVAVADAQADLRRVGHHLDCVTVRALVDGGCHQRLEPRADLSGRQVAGRRDEFNPQRHGTFATVTQLEHCAARNGAVVDEIEHAHLIEVKDHLELGRRVDVQAVEVSVDVLQRADEAWLLDLDLTQNVLDDLAHFTDRLCDGDLARVDSLVVELVELEQQLALCCHHLAGLHQLLQFSIHVLKSRRLGQTSRRTIIVL